MYKRGVTTLILIFITTVALVSLTNAQLVVSGSYSPDYHFIVNGKDFFPIGWYIHQSKKTPTYASEIEDIKRSGVNIVTTYPQDIIYSYTDSTHWDLGSYTYHLGEFINDMAPMKVLVHLTSQALDPNTTDSLLNATLGLRHKFTWSGVHRLVNKYNSRVLGYIIAEEPLGSCRKYHGPFPNTVKQLNDSLKLWAPNKIRLFVTNTSGGNTIETNGNSVSVSDVFSDYGPNNFNAIGFDEYAFWKSSAYDPGSTPWSDFNSVARNAVYHVWNYITGNGSTIKPKYGHIFIGMAHENWTDQRGNHLFIPLNRKLIEYQAFSPIIQGSRGLMYWAMNNTFYSDSTFNNINTLNNFIVNYDNGLITKVILDGIKKNGLVFNNFTLENASGSTRRVGYDDYTWQYYNNYALKDSPPDPFYYHKYSGVADSNFHLVNYLLKKYQGNYYLFIVNDFKNKVLTNLSFNNILDPDESVLKITKINPYGSDEQVDHNSSSLNNPGHPVLHVELSKYEVQIYRISVQK